MKYCIVGQMKLSYKYHLFVLEQGLQIKKYTKWLTSVHYLDVWHEGYIPENVSFNYATENFIYFVFATTNC